MSSPSVGDLVEWNGLTGEVIEDRGGRCRCVRFPEFTYWIGADYLTVIEGSMQGHDPKVE